MLVSAKLVKELREKTGVAMMDCKKALVAENGDLKKATDFLRKQGLAKANKKSSRTVSEGLTAVKVSGNVGVAIEVNAETDFVSKNDQFLALTKEILDLALHVDNVDQLKNAVTSSGETVADFLVNNIATIGENITLRRMSKLKVSEGVIASYVHNPVKENMGKISSVVALESNTKDKEKLFKFGKQLAMHIAAVNPTPLYLSEDLVEQDVIDREKSIFIEQAKAKAPGKPDNVINNITTGMVQKYLQEIVLLNQVFIIDNKTKISDLLKQKEKELGTAITIKGYINFILGDGIEKEVKNFSDEVSYVLSQ